MKNQKNKILDVIPVKLNQESSQIEVPVLAINQFPINITSLDNEVAALADETAELFKVLDAESNKIHQLETILGNFKLNLPFSIFVDSEVLSSHWTPKKEHREAYDNPVRYFYKTYWFLSWEAAEDSSKKYRLYLISEKREIVVHEVSSGLKESIYDSNGEYRKPLGETPLAIRFKYIKHLTPFIISLKDHLRANRLAIIQGDIPF
jgi:hypothetical protein